MSTRAEKALATRRRMIEGAYRKFCSDGYAGTTMNAIAEEAGVAVQTLYYTFHNKAALLGEAIGAAVVGFEGWREPPADPTVGDLMAFTPWWPDFADAPTTRNALECFVGAGVGILERMGPLMAAMHGGTGDADAEAVVRVAEERRVAMYREVAKLLARKPGGLRTGLTVPGATDLLVVLFSADLYQALRAGRGWSHARCTLFFHDLLATQLLPA